MATARTRAPVAVAVITLALGGFGAGGCDDEGERASEPRGGERPAAGDLAWRGRPRLVVPETLPRDRILSGTLQNRSLRPVELSASQLRVVDARDKPLPTAAVFLRTYVHGLYPPTRRPKRPSETELRRTGKKAVIGPGKSAPVTVSWRQSTGASQAAELDFGAGSLAIPRS